jgi:radical S-adenosyl methionine domain-containing protein 2
MEQHDTPESVNIHLTERCNYRCGFCFSSGRKDCPESPVGTWKRIIEDLVLERGITKVNFAGGEPLMYPGLLELVRFTHEIGCTTSIVTNGSLMDGTAILRLAPCLDWAGLSVDSVSEETERTLGRSCGRCEHLSNIVMVADLLKERDVKVKLNVTVTRQSLDDDFHDLVHRIGPQRVKFLQVSRVEGNNDLLFDRYAITDEQFAGFRERHSDIVLANGLAPVFEESSMVADSYFMMGPTAKVRMNTPEGYRFVDYDEYWSIPSDQRINMCNYAARGAVYGWRAPRQMIFLEKNMR